MDLGRAEHRFGMGRMRWNFNKKTIQKMVFNAKDYSNREELEDAVAHAAGKTADLKVDFEITGTAEELAKLRLSHAQSVWGVRCMATDAEVSVKTEVPQRGENKNIKIKEK